MSGRISALKNKINRLQNTFTFKSINAKDKEITFLKQEGQCKQVEIDSLEQLLDLSNKNLRDSNEIINKMDKYIKSLEDKKIKNKIKKLFNS